MLSQMQNAAEQVPVWAWAVLLSITLVSTLTFGYRLATKRQTRVNLSKTADPTKRRNRIGFAGMGLVIVAGLALSTNTSARFAEKRLHMDAPWHTTVGLVLEAIVIGLSFYAWAFNDKGATRVAYLLVLAQAVGAIEVVRQEHEDIGTALVRIVGPVMLAYGLHKLLGLEAKLGKVEIKSDSLIARAWRDRLKRLESKLGIGSRGADAESISRRNAQDKLVALVTLGKPWLMGKRAYEKALMRAGDASFHGIADTLDEFGVEMRITTRIDRMRAFKELPDRNEKYALRSLRPALGAQGAPAPAGDDGNALTSEGAPGRTSEHGAGAPGANLGEAQASGGLTEGVLDRRALAFDVYFDLRKGDQAPSQNAFEKAWRDKGYGLKTDDIRALYKEVHNKITGHNA
ncbi:hypothetical protein ACH4TP_38135 [Streptomyces sp. NPDC021012]|uniref:hypothetical protein n=1 Tax=Streptomyces sp. NPDC021012 TaxID=3365107 RepID=UPI0037BB5957